MINTFKVSVIIPTYKRAEKLDFAIESVLAQTYGSVEVVVVDDNDPESEFRRITESKMNKYITNKKVTYIKNKENLGGSLARNEGIKISTGDYITFLDDDDVYLPNKISEQVSYMIEENLEMTFTDLGLYNTDEKLIDYREFNFIKSFEKSDLLKYHLTRNLTGTPTFMYKREAIETIGGFEDAYCGQEFYLMMMTIEGDFRIGYIPKSNVKAYIHNSEKISNGKSKITGEKKLMQFKKKYFSYITIREKMYIYWRYHAVMAVTGKRNSRYFMFFKHSILSLLSSPIDFITELFKYMNKLTKIKRGVMHHESIQKNY